MNKIHKSKNRLWHRIHKRYQKVRRFWKLVEKEMTRNLIGSWKEENVIQEILKSEGIVGLPYAENSDWIINTFKRGN